MTTLIETLVVSLGKLAINAVKWIDNSAILSGLVVTMVAGGILAFVLRTPEFELTLEPNLLPGSTNGQLDFILENKKRFQYYEKGDIYYHIYVPRTVLSNWKNWNNTVITGAGTQIGLHREYEFISTIDGEEYVELRGSVDLSLFPERTVPVLSIQGALSAEETFKVYYYFSTKYGTFPNYVRLKRSIVYKKITNDNLNEIRSSLPIAIWKDAHIFPIHSSINN